MAEKLSDLFDRAQSPSVTWNGQLVYSMYELPTIEDGTSLRLAFAPPLPDTPSRSTVINNPSATRPDTTPPSVTHRHQTRDRHQDHQEHQPPNPNPPQNWLKPDQTTLHLALLVGRGRQRSSRCFVCAWWSSDSSSLAAGSPAVPFHFVLQAGPSDVAAYVHVARRPGSRCRTSSADVDLSDLATRCRARARPSGR